MEKKVIGEVVSGAVDYLEVAERIDIDRERIGMTCMRPFVDLLPRLKREVHGFGPEDIVRALGCWIAFDNDEDWDGGYLLQLADGRRAELDILAPAFEFGDDMKVAVMLHPPAYSWTDVPRSHPVSGYGWVDFLPELDSLLSVVAVALLGKTGHLHQAPPSVN